MQGPAPFASGQLTLRLTFTHPQTHKQCERRYSREGSALQGEVAVSLKESTLVTKLGLVSFQQLPFAMLLDLETFKQREH